MSAPLRVRFAPSPTGLLHVGNARTALFNWLLARGSGGTFILRIEDTDAERSTSASEASILQDLRWLGLEWDEGVDAGGRLGPYRQSERLDIYLARVHELLDRGLAYRCFCSPEELEAERVAALASGAPPKYSGRCRHLSTADIEARLSAGTRAAVRFVVPVNRDVTFSDIVRGEVTINTAVIGDPVILRSDGRPAYNFAVVIDDAMMEVTHVIRGEDHISNTPRQVLVYEAFGWTPPLFAHLSLVMGPDHAPLSKRHGATSVSEFRERGFLPEALVNYLALLGWSPGQQDGQNEELMPALEMARRFDLRKVSHSAAVFDVQKLEWMNRHYMKEAAPGRLAREALPYFARAGFVSGADERAITYIESLQTLAIGSVDRVEQIPARVAFIFEWDAARAAAIVRQEADGGRAVSAFATAVAGTGALNRDSFRVGVAAAKAATGLKGRALLHPIRVALTGADSGPELDLLVPVIDQGAAIHGAAGVAPIVSCAERALRVAKLIN